MNNLVQETPATVDFDYELQSIVSQALDYASGDGASEISAIASRSFSYDLTVRLGEVETVEHENSKELAVKVLFGKSSGVAATSEFSEQAIRDTVAAACSIAKYTAQDPYNGLPPKDKLATQFPDLELYHPWDLGREQALEIALKCENAARSEDDRIVNSDGATVSTSSKFTALGNSSGFLASVSGSNHSLGCVVIGESAAGMQNGYWFTSAREFDQLDSPELVGRTAAQRTLRKLDAQRIKTCEVPVLIEAPVAASLLSTFIKAISGSALYRGTTFLVDSIGTQVFPEWVRIYEQPHLKRSIGGKVFDVEGVATNSRDIVTDGVVQGYVLDTYSARKLGMETTGNASGTSNLTIDSSQQNFEDLIRQMDTGLLVTDFIGFGINLVTGDYSRGANGFWVENGEIKYPVEELTVAGNLRDMFKSIVAVGNDADPRRSIRTGSILLERMAVGGN